MQEGSRACVHSQAREEMQDGSRERLQASEED